MRQVSQAGREFAQGQIAEIQDLRPGSPGLFDAPFRLSQVWLHDG